MDIRGKKVFVLGAARSGISAALLAKSLGAYVFVSDMKTEEKLGSLSLLKANGINYETGRNSFEKITGFNVLILSPGVHLEEALKGEIKSRGLSVMSELEFAFRYINIPIIAITGTNGKSTTTALIGHILNSAGIPAFVGGNIGNALSNLILEQKRYECAVVEVSSFMLEDIEKFRPAVTVFTNISPDHLDRYPDYKSYVTAKLNIFRNLNENSPVILNLDCNELIRFIEKFNVKKRFFSISGGKDADIYSEKNSGLTGLTFKLSLRGEIITYENKNLVGEHNLENVLAASAAAFEYGVRTELIEKGINTFKGLEHRIEFVREIKGVRFYNDSKATNIDSSKVALKSFDKGIIWIAGGRHKGTPYIELKGLVKDRVKKIIAIGEAAPLIYDDLKDVADIEKFGIDFEGAIKRAFEIADINDVVLLSPACSSYDMFTNYEERGKRFKDIVKGIKE